MPHNATTPEEVALSFRQMKLTTLTLLYDEEGPDGEQHCVSVPMSSEYEEVLNDARQSFEEYLPGNPNSYKFELKHEISKGRWATVHPRAFADLVGSSRGGDLEFKFSARPARNRESISSTNQGQNVNTSTRSSNVAPAVAPPDYSTVVAQQTPRSIPSTQVLNTPIIPIRAHEHEAFCDRCQSRIFTVRYKCTVCNDFDYCVVCIGFAPLEHGHHFAAIINSNTWLYRPQDSWRITDPGRATEAPALTGNEPIHEARCDVCGITPIVGTRYKCADCPDWDTCQSCLERSLRVHPEHTFIRVTQPGVLMMRRTKAPRLVRTGHNCNLCTREIIGPTYFQCNNRGCVVNLLCADCEALPSRQESGPCRHSLVKHYV